MPKSFKKKYFTKNLYFFFFMLISLLFFGYKIKAQETKPEEKAEIKPESKPPQKELYCSENSKWCWDYPLPHGVRIYDIWGSDQNHVWAIGEDGYIFHFDGKATSIQEISGEENFKKDLNAIWGLDEKHIWVVGEDGTILFYDGKEWTKQHNDGPSLHSIHGIDEKHVWAVGDREQILFWNGSKWERWNSSKTDYKTRARNNFYQVFAINVSNVWVLGNYGQVYVGEENNFSLKKEIPTKKSITSIWGETPSCIWLLDEAENILFWNGSTWKKEELDFKPQSIWGTDKNNRWSVSKTGEIYFWEAKNSTWVKENLTTQEPDVKLIRGTNPSHLWALSGIGGILKRENSAWKEITPSVKRRSIEGAWIDPKTSQLWAVGEEGVILYKSEKDATWQPQKSGTTNNLTAVQGIDDTHIWAAGTGGTVLFFDGKEWKKERTDITEDLIAVWSSAEDEIWALSRASIYKKEGQKWKEVSKKFPQKTILYEDGKGGTQEEKANQEYEFFEIWAVDKNNVWVVENNGIFYWNGKRWDEHKIVITNFRGIHGSDKKNVWVIRDNKSYLRWDGKKWHDENLPTEKDLQSIWVKDSANTWVLTKDGDLFFYNGKNWKEEEYPLDDIKRDLSKFMVDPKGNQWLFGDGIIFKKEAQLEVLPNSSPTAESSSGTVSSDKK